MPKRLMVIQGHPDAQSARLCHALAEYYIKGARSVGSEIRQFDVGQMDFPLLRTKAEFDLGRSGTPKSLLPAQDALLWAEHLMIIYPLWHGTMPALLKGFIEQVFRPDVVEKPVERGFPKKMLLGKSARVVVTMGMPVWAYRWYFGAHSLKSLKRNILKFSGINPVRSTLFGMVENVSQEKRQGWLTEMEEAGKRDVRIKRG